MANMANRCDHWCRHEYHDGKVEANLLVYHNPKSWLQTSRIEKTATAKHCSVKFEQSLIDAQS